MKKLTNNITVTDNKLKVYLTKDNSDFSENSVLKILKDEKIEGEINYELLASLNDKSVVAKFQNQVIIAEAPASLRAQCEQVKFIKTLADWECLYSVFHSAGAVLNKLKRTKQITTMINPPTLFVSAGSIFLRIKVSEYGENLFGEKVKPEALRPIKYNSDNIRQDIIGDEILYYAEKTGYISYRNGTISIESPFYDKNEYERYYIFYPVFEDTKPMEQEYEKTLGLYREKYPNAPVALPGGLTESESVDGSDVYIIEFCKGVRPIDGQDAEIRFLINRDTEDINKNTKEFKHYLIVKENDVIAEKKHRVNGVRGLDLFGKNIEVREAKDKILRTNELIRQESSPGKTLYRASCDGILKMAENSIKISEAMILPDYVDYSTGNIEYGKDVYVGKDIKPQFEVKTGGDLIVKGSIEDGANIFVQGDLLVDGGIVGQNTKVFIKGNATVKFIQDADVYVSGDLRIKTSLIGGKVFAGGSLIVQGKKGSSRSQVFGGEYCSFVRMELPSVGSPYKKTILWCGYNPRIKGLIKASEETLKSIELQMSRLLNSIGVNITNPAARRIIERLSPEKKKLLKVKLLKLKELTTQLNELKGKKANLVGMLYSQHPESLEILVKDRLIPDTTVTFMKTSINISKDTSSSRVIIDDSGIDILNL
ncbi:MAG: FapA family protein [Spirochaetales bacterium]|uniref:FapA family protein n=1 Tax=Candidatus Thalassospirochaeta sargassi TaxID=3119039 RepID=A0AAJ1I9V4_9SPIO|nr:FapA family protein [Spirochaetales bacterium]